MKILNKVQFDTETQAKLDYIDELRKMHDIDYARKCKIDAILKEYHEMIDTDIWYEAAKAWVNEKIDQNYHKLKTFYYLDNTGYLLSTGLDGGLTYSSTLPDIQLNTIDNTILISELHNADPKIEGYEFERFCIDYKRKHEEGQNNSSI
jgi:hypothetical protein